MKGAHRVTSFSSDFWDADTAVLLAVKPQDCDGVLNDLKQMGHPSGLLISIAAGVSLERLHEKSGCAAVVRVMPNTPALIGQGASGWLASSVVTPSQKECVRSMLNTFGLAMEVHDEAELDAVTAFSGSGPAYVFYFIEALTQGGIALGLSVEQALALALQTVYGGASLAKAQATSLEELTSLRAKVTSKGGTTERAIGLFETKNFKKIIADAMQASYERAKELRRPLSPTSRY